MSPPFITVLGAGPAGLAAAYFARRAGLDGVVFEAGVRAGGNCVTLTHEGFSFDTGAHRFHDRHPEITAVVRSLLGDELIRVSAPSRIVYQGGLVDFPLSPLNTLRSLGVRQSVRATIDLVRARMDRGVVGEDFESYALRAYGRTIAEAFLLGYSEKLWGVPCSSLSREVAGARLKGLTLGTFLSDAVRRRARRTAHLDGVFLYPRSGIGRIVDALAEACGPERIRLQARVTAMRHESGRIRAIEINGREVVPVDVVISTLPLNALTLMLDPPAPAPLLEAAGALRFRHTVLAAFLLDRPSVTDCATVYFSSREVPFTRVYEPRNRSPAMSPPGRTSLVAELPSGPADRIWHMDDAAVIRTVRDPLVRLEWLRERDIIGTLVHRLVNTYPVLDLASRQHVQDLERYLAGFVNLRLAGRVGRFAYSHVHDQLRQGREVVADLNRGIFG